jgi:hypothetical protein
VLNRFTNILNDNGIFTHINDNILDQTSLFYHKSDNIASGFYTAERRIIPLKDKLVSMNNDIADLKSELLSATDMCKVILSVGNNNTEILSNTDNILQLVSYKDIATNVKNGTSMYDGVYVFDDVKKTVSVIINLNICNTSDRAMKLYSVFPGNRNVLLNDTVTKFVDKDNYCRNHEQQNNNYVKAGVFFKHKSTNGNDTVALQSQNQFVTFRINDVWTHNEYYASNANSETINKQNILDLPKISSTTTCGMTVYPLLANKYDLCINSDDSKSYLVINPNEYKTVPILCEYKITEEDKHMEKTISFDLRTSLYKDLTNYTFTVVAKNNTTQIDKLQNSVSSNIKYDTTITK